MTNLCRELFLVCSVTELFLQVYIDIAFSAGVQLEYLRLCEFLDSCHQSNRFTAISVFRCYHDTPNLNMIAVFSVSDRTYDPAGLIPLDQDRPVFKICTVLFK